MVFKFLKESYGGAYDINEWQLFSKDELFYFAEIIITKLNRLFNRVFEITNVYSEDSKNSHSIYLEIKDTKTDETYSLSKKLDLRRVRTTRELNSTFAQYFVEYFSEKIKQLDAFYVD